MVQKLKPLEALKMLQNELQQGMAFERCPTCGELVASVKRHFCVGKSSALAGAATGVDIARSPKVQILGGAPSSGGSVEGHASGAVKASPTSRNAPRVSKPSRVVGVEPHPPEDKSSSDLADILCKKLAFAGCRAEGATSKPPTNLPDNWDYQPNTNSVVCGGCLFRFGAEHPDGDGKWTCPNCGDGNGERQSLAKCEREVVFLREIDAGTDSACWTVCNRVDPGATPFFMGVDAATDRRSQPAKE